MDQQRWRKLCEAATVEQDPQKLLELISEILEILNRKYESLTNTKGKITLQRKPS